MTISCPRGVAMALAIAWVVPTMAQGDTGSSPLDDFLPLRDVYEKLTDNRGEGYEPLYGTRNLRQVLPGVVYRGGANNKWHDSAPRDNRNPLPPDGLENLCDSGFGRAYYLYRRNYEEAPHAVQCGGPGATRQLTYHQASAASEAGAYAVLSAAHRVINDPGHGPIYVHCWNGWHASGLMAAKILRQFCGWSASEAVAYWNRATDGHDGAPRYERIRQMIRDFTPYPELAISAEAAARVCPARPVDQPG